jgi:protoporphyrinogen/coproporphyrinogen III oxidase
LDSNADSNASKVEAVQMYPPLADPGADLLKATKDAGCITVQLTYDGYTEEQPFLIMVPTAASSKIGTLFLEQAQVTDRNPRGATLLSAFIALHSDSGPTWSDDRLIGIVRELAAPLPELGGNFRTGRATRWQYASHQGEVGYYAALQQFLDNYPAEEPVQVAGDYLATSGQETAVTTGMKAADRTAAVS